MFNRRQILAALPVAAFPFTTLASDNFPAKPIKIVIPVTSAGGVEALVRLVATKLADGFGQPVIIENRPGGNAQLGINHVARSPADGYTLGLGFVTNLSLAPHTFKSMQYDPQKDLTPVALLGTNYLAVVAQPDAPLTSVAELARWGKSTASGLTVGTTSNGGLPHLAFEQLARATGTPFLVVSYNGNGQLIQDLMGGRINVAMVDYTFVAQFVETGKLRLLGITNPSRDPQLPNLPVIGESVKGYEAVGWFGIVAPTGTPKAVVSALNKAIVAALGMPDVKELMVNFAILAAPGTPEDFAALLQREDRKYADLVKQIGFKPQ